MPDEREPTAAHVAVRKDYDENIRPLVNQLAEACKERGFALILGVAKRVDSGRGECWITTGFKEREVPNSFRAAQAIIEGGVLAVPIDSVLGDMLKSVLGTDCDTCKTDCPMAKGKPEPERQN